MGSNTSAPPPPAPDLFNVFDGLATLKVVNPSSTESITPSFAPPPAPPGPAPDLFNVFNGLATLKVVNPSSTGFITPSFTPLPVPQPVTTPAVTTNATPATTVIKSTPASAMAEITTAETTPNNRLTIGFGVALLVCGLILIVVLVVWAAKK